jgi:hypothetical protein
VPAFELIHNKILNHFYKFSQHSFRVFSLVSDKNQFFKQKEEFLPSKNPLFLLQNDT